MSEITSRDRTGNGALPVRVAFDPESSAAPLDVATLGTVVLLLVGRTERRWAADAAVALCAEWARSGRRVVLADLHLENPVLHEAAGTENLEGIVDVFLYGASIARSARPVRKHGFYLIPAGTYEPDADALYRHPRWPKLVAGFRDATASLVLFVPEHAVDLGAMAQWTQDALLLGEPVDPALAEMLAENGVALHAVLTPAGAAAEPRVDDRFVDEAPVPPPVPAGTTYVEEETYVAEEPAGAADEWTQPTGESGREDRSLRLPPEPEREAAGGGRRMMIGVAVVLLVLLLAALGFWVTRLRPGLGSGGTSEAVGMAPVEATTPAPAAPSRSGSPLPYSVQMVAYNSLNAAQEQVDVQRASLPDVPLFITPEEIQGVMYYKVQAGALTDTTAAKQLQQRLVADEAIDEEEASGTFSLVQYTPLAFDLGEFATAEESAAAADSLAVREIPAYAVAMPYSDGSRRWQLYGGAYRDSVSADAMRQRLVSAGVQPRLVARIGESPAPPGSQP